MTLNCLYPGFREGVDADLFRFYTSATVSEAELKLGDFEDCWDGDYRRIGAF